MIDRLIKVCLCKGVSQHTIKECIKEGSITLEDIAKNTGATTGGCKGKRCKEKIESLISEEK